MTNIKAYDFPIAIHSITGDKEEPLLLNTLMVQPVVVILNTDTDTLPIFPAVPDVDKQATTFGAIEKVDANDTILSAYEFVLMLPMVS